MTYQSTLAEPPMLRLRPALQGAIAILPLCLAVLPWGILAGSMAIQSGLTAAEGLGMSAIVFAGASQLVAMGMIKTGAGLLAILVSTFFVTAQHFLYGLRLRECIAPLPLRWRILLAFLLTDELFALTGNQGPARFNRWYALGAGLAFYVCWFFATLLGVLAASSVSNLDSYGLDFSIAATFIAIVVPMIRNLPVLACVLTALGLSIGLHYYQVPGALIITTIAAMVVGLLSSRERA
ncbi:branched-chain amino acid ABC transporter permease [Chania multitudinisentens RB-25]|uniref:Branched-chain amino acid ABC transporter permease n=1 Tax=Chania multitudinisentens RB-25 TaxID=1441930 RepID=W0LH95_9GAMM|nr:AzlC family ABC transporter permease [Chania multitudinisentens]AHG21759.1 branched-chain amino acid ABC transporter permease [Chania multitudinisentens RB-25]